MPRQPTRFVSASELEKLFIELELWHRIRDGRLSTQVIRETPAHNPSYIGGVSQILVHHDADGQHRCTTHRIVDSGGNVLHWDEADVKLETETVAKAHEQVG